MAREQPTKKSLFLLQHYFHAKKTWIPMIGETGSGGSKPFLDKIHIRGEVKSMSLTGGGRGFEKLPFFEDKWTIRHSVWGRGDEIFRSGILFPWPLTQRSASWFVKSGPFRGSHSRLFAVIFGTARKGSITPSHHHMGLRRKLEKLAETFWSDSSSSRHKIGNFKN